MKSKIISTIMIATICVNQVSTVAIYAGEIDTKDKSNVSEKNETFTTFSSSILGDLDKNNTENTTYSNTDSSDVQEDEHDVIDETTNSSNNSVSQADPESGEKNSKGSTGGSSTQETTTETSVENSEKAAVPASSSEAESTVKDTILNGKIKQGIEWEFNISTGVLRFTNTERKINNYYGIDATDVVPWEIGQPLYQYRSNIREIYGDKDTGLLVAYDGFGNIGRLLEPIQIAKPGAFQGLFNLKKVGLLNFVSMKDMFKNCSNLEAVIAVGTASSSGILPYDWSGAFVGCYNLREISIDPIIKSDRGIFVPEIRKYSPGITGLENYSIQWSENSGQWNTYADYSIEETYSLLLSAKRWGDVSWDFDESSGILTVASDGFYVGDSALSPWIREGPNKINGSMVKKIQISGAGAGIKDANSLFANLPNLEEIDGLSKLDFSKIMDFSSMFQGDKSLKQINISDIGRTVKSYATMEKMFEGCNSLKKLDFSSFSRKRSAHFTSNEGMLNGTSLESLTIASDDFNVGSSTPTPILNTNGNPLVTTTTGKWIKSDYSGLSYSPEDFAKGINSNIVPVGEYVAEPLLWGTSVWNFDPETGKLAVSKGTLGTAEEAPWNRDDEWNIDATDITSITFQDGVIANKESSDLFKGLKNCESYSNIESIDFSEANDIDGMFQDNSSLESLTLGASNKIRSVNWQNMFNGASSLKKVDLSDVNVDYASIDGMFLNAKSIKNIDLSGIKNVMFHDYNTKVFDGIDSLESIVFPENFLLHAVSYFPPSFGGLKTGKWMKESDKSKAYTSDELKIEAASTSIGGKWIAEQLYWGSSPCLFDEDTGVLTIYPGTLGTYEESPWKRNDAYKIAANNIKTIKFEGEVKSPELSSYLFANLDKLEEFVNLKFLNTSETTDMGYMFSGLSNLSSLDVSNFDTSKVMHMTGMFQLMVSLKSLDVSNFDTSQVTEMGRMFYYQTNLCSLDLSNFDTSKVYSTADMFRDLESLRNITLGDNFSFRDKDNSGLKILKSINGDENVTGNIIKEDGSSKAYSPSDFMLNYGKGDLTAGTYVAERTRWGTSPWSFDKTTGELTVFEGNLGTSADSPWNRKDSFAIDPNSITKIIFDGAIKAPQNSFSLFSSTDFSFELKNLKSIEGLDKFDTSDTTSMSFMFKGASSLVSLNLSHFNTGQVTNMSSMFQGNSSLSSLNINSFDTSKVQNMSRMFSGTTNLSTLELSDKFRFTTDAALPSPTSDEYTGKWVKSDYSTFSYSAEDFMKSYGDGELTAGKYIAEKSDVLRWGSSRWTFDKESGILTISEGKLAEYSESPWNRNDDKQINFEEIKKIDIVGKVIAPVNSSKLFSSNTSDSLNKLTEITGLNNLDTSQANDMSYMFSGCKSLKHFELKNWNTSQVTNMSYMFLSLWSLEKLDVSNFDTRKVTDMTSMFAESESLTSLNLSNFDTRQVTKMISMFSSMTKLKSLDLSNFDTKLVNDMSWMFRFTDELRSIKLGEYFNFRTDASFPTPEGEMYTGKWIKSDLTTSAYNATEFMEKYGTDELTSGEYIAETIKPISLALSIDIKTNDGNNSDDIHIGDSLKAEITVKNKASENTRTVESPELAINDFLDSSAFENAKNSVTAEVYNEDTNQRVSQVDIEIKDNKVVLPNIQSGQYLVVLITGKAWNNSTKGKNNLNISIKYYNGVSDVNEKLEGYKEIKNGLLKFEKVPDSIEYQETPLSMFKDKLINRKNGEFEIEISDLRGTNPINSGESFASRQDWTVTATSGTFKDKDGNEIPNASLSLAYVNDENFIYLDDKNEVGIEEHHVNSETPKENNKSNIFWESEQGIQLIARNRNGLKTGEKYTAVINFELRSAP